MRRLNLALACLGFLTAGPALAQTAPYTTQTPPADPAYQAPYVSAPGGVRFNEQMNPANPGNGLAQRRINGSDNMIQPQP